MGKSNTYERAASTFNHRKNSAPHTETLEDVKRYMLVAEQLHAEETALFNNVTNHNEYTNVFLIADTLYQLKLQRRIHWVLLPIVLSFGQSAIPLKMASHRGISEMECR